MGFGDISPQHFLEQIFVIILMLIGVSAFSFATGSLSSLMNSLDSVSAKLKKKTQILENIKKQY